jgi:hypothetical protein
MSEWFSEVFQQHHVLNEHPLDERQMFSIWRGYDGGDLCRSKKMKDGRTHLAHKAEHAVDLDTGAVVAATLQGADQGDTKTLDETLSEARGWRWRS